MLTCYCHLGWIVSLCSLFAVQNGLIWNWLAELVLELHAIYWKQEAASSSLVRLKGDVTNINVLTWRIDEYLLRLMVDLLQAKWSRTNQMLTDKRSDNLKRWGSAIAVATIGELSRADGMSLFLHGFFQVQRPIPWRCVLKFETSLRHRWLCEQSAIAIINTTDLKDSSGWSYINLLLILRS